MIIIGRRDDWCDECRAEIVILSNKKELKKELDYLLEDSNYFLTYDKNFSSDPYNLKKDEVMVLDEKFKLVDIEVKRTVTI